MATEETEGLPVEAFAIVGEVNDALIERLRTLGGAITAANALNLMAVLEAYDDERVTRAELVLRDEENGLNEVLRVERKAGIATLRLVGTIHPELARYKGIPLVAQFDGTFISSLVKNGQEVKRGYPLGTAQTAKGGQNILSPVAGMVTVVAEDGSPAVKGETTLFYIQEPEGKQ